MTNCIIRLQVRSPRWSSDGGFARFGMQGEFLEGWLYEPVSQNPL